MCIYYYFFYKPQLRQLQKFMKLCENVKFILRLIRDCLLRYMSRYFSQFFGRVIRIRVLRERVIRESTVYISNHFYLELFYSEIRQWCFTHDRFWFMFAISTIWYSKLKKHFQNNRYSEFLRMLFINILI